MKKLKLKPGIALIKKKVSKIKKKVILVGIAGGSGSGKGYIAKKLKWKILPADAYYFGKGLNPAHDYDSPESLDLCLMETHLKNLKKGKPINKPVYDFTRQKRVGWEKFYPSKIIIVEGLFVLRQPTKRLLDVKVFVDAPIDVRFSRRMKRDLAEKRWGTKAQIKKMFFKQAEPNYKKYITRTRRGAIIIDNSKDL